jgi:TonB-linked SusC/RagA family outer membrane protein
MKQPFYCRVVRHCLLFMLFALSQEVRSQHLSLADNPSLASGRQNLKQDSSIPLKEALLQLENRFNIHFTYNEKTLEGRQVMVKDNSAKNLDELLDELLKVHRLKFKRYQKPDNTYFIYPSKEKAEPAIDAAGAGTSLPEEVQQKAEVSVKGKVTNETGEALPGVSVVVKGTTNGTATNADGSYAIALSDGNSTLVFSFIGYLTQEVPVNNQTTLDIKLLSDIKALSEVVVVGYGTQKKSDLTSAISSIDNKKLEGRPVQTAEALLQGQAAGLTITNNGGEPGSGGKVRIRGVGTFGNNDPLYIVDGIPVNNGLNFLNPNDIEDIQVFKDAAAAAIYGNRAANGVVYVTTKKGKSGKRQITFDAYYGVANNGQVQPMQDATEYMAYAKLKNADGSLNALAAKGYNTNWVDEVMRTGKNQNYSLGIRGGSVDHTYFISAGYSNVQGTHLKSDNERFTARLNTDNNLFKWLKVSENLTVSYETRHNNNVFNAARGTAPIAPVYKSEAEIAALDPSLRQFDQFYDVSQGVSFGTNQRAAIERSNGTRNWLSVYGNVQAELNFGSLIKPLEGLKFTSTLGFERIQEDYSSFDPVYRLGTKDYRLTTHVRDEFSKYFHWTWNNFLTYNKTFGMHTLGLTAGIVAEEETKRYISADGSSGISNGQFLQIIDAMSAQRTNGGSAFKHNYFSYVGRLTYSYDDRFLFQASIRRDGSYRFAPDLRWGTFPSIGLGWKISNEQFFQNLDLTWLNELKLRGSWGQLGNEKIASEYEYLSLIGGSFNRGYVLGGVGGSNASKHFVQGYGPTGLPNPLLSWETTTSTNIGIDLGLLKNRLRVGFDYYDRNTQDVLYKKTLPLYSGVPASDGIAPVSQWVNGASIVNRGFELSLGYAANIGKLGVDLGFNIARYKAKVDKLKDDVPITVNDERIPTVIQMKEGDPLGAFYGYTVAGFYNSEAELKNSKGQEILPGAQVGDFKFVDTNSDGVVDSKDRKVIGNPNPDFVYSFNLNFTFKRFDLKTFWYGTQGNDIYKIGDIYLSGWDENSLQNIWSGVVANSWRPDNLNAQYPKVSPGGTKRNYEKGPNSYSIKDGSFMRLKNVQLGYTIPATAFGKTGIESLRIYVSAENLFVLTPYKGDDPEIGNGIRLNSNEGGVNNSPSYIMGMDYGDRYPIQKTYTIGLSVKF